VIRVAWPRSRRRWCSMTVSARAWPLAISARRLTAFWNRDRVGCDARGRPVTGLRPITSVDGIVGQPSGVVAVGVTGREPEHALPDQLDQLGDVVPLLLHRSRIIQART